MEFLFHHSGSSVLHMDSMCVTERSVWVQLLKSQSIGQAGGKESLPYFRCQQLSGEEGRYLSKGLRHPLPPPNAPTLRESFHRQSEGEGLCAGTAQSADHHLQTGHHWSDQPILGCFKYSQSSVPGAICSHFFVVSSQNYGSLCPGYSLVIM